MSTVETANPLHSGGSASESKEDAGGASKPAGVRAPNVTSPANIGRLTRSNTVTEAVRRRASLATDRDKHEFSLFGGRSVMDTHDVELALAIDASLHSPPTMAMNTRLLKGALPLALLYGAMTNINGYGPTVLVIVYVAVIIGLSIVAKLKDPPMVAKAYSHGFPGLDYLLSWEDTFKLAPTWATTWIYLVHPLGFIVSNFILLGYSSGIAANKLEPTYCPVANLTRLDNTTCPGIVLVSYSHLIAATFHGFVIFALAVAIPWEPSDATEVRDELARKRCIEVDNNFNALLREMDKVAHRSLYHGARTNTEAKQVLAAGCGVGVILFIEPRLLTNNADPASFIIWVMDATIIAIDMYCAVMMAKGVNRQYKVCLARIQALGSPVVAALFPQPANAREATAGPAPPPPVKAGTFVGGYKWWKLRTYVTLKNKIAYQAFAWGSAYSVFALLSGFGWALFKVFTAAEGQALAHLLQSFNVALVYGSLMIGTVGVQILLSTVSVHYEQKHHKRFLQEQRFMAHHSVMDSEVREAFDGFVDDANDMMDEYDKSATIFGLEMSPALIIAFKGYVATAVAAIGAKIASDLSGGGGDD